MRSYTGSVSEWKHKPRHPKLQHAELHIDCSSKKFTFPSASTMASWASLGSSKLMKPKPLDLPVSGL